MNITQYEFLMKQRVEKYGGQAKYNLAMALAYQRDPEDYTPKQFPAISDHVKNYIRGRTKGTMDHNHDYAMMVNRFVSAFKEALEYNQDSRDQLNSDYLILLENKMEKEAEEVMNLKNMHDLVINNAEQQLYRYAIRCMDIDSRARK